MDVDLIQRQLDIQRESLISVSKAQRVYITTLLGYMAFFWCWFLFPSTDGVKLPGLDFDIPEQGVWMVSPFVVTWLSLAVVGSLNAAEPIWTRIKDLQAQIGKASGSPCDLVFYDLDTEKNILDYLTFLRIHPERRISQEKDRVVMFQHFIYPSLLIVAHITTSVALVKLFLPDSLTGRVIWSVGFVVFLVQLLYSARRHWLAFCRFAGIRTEHVQY